MLIYSNTTVTYSNSNIQLQQYWLFQILCVLHLTYFLAHVETAMQTRAPNFAAVNCKKQERKYCPYQARAPPFSFPSLCQQAGTSLRGHRSGWKPPRMFSQRSEAMDALTTAGRDITENCGYPRFTGQKTDAQSRPKNTKLKSNKDPMDNIFSVLIFIPRTNDK